MLDKLTNIDKIIKSNNLDPKSVVLVTNHIMAKYLTKNKWIICHVEGDKLVDCREYKSLDDAIEVVKLILGSERWR